LSQPSIPPLDRGIMEIMSDYKGLYTEDWRYLPHPSPFFVDAVTLLADLHAFKIRSYLHDKIFNA
jgi:hypothetical protein